MFILEAIFQDRAVRFVLVGLLNTLINISVGFCDNEKINFCQLFESLSWHDFFQENSELFDIVTYSNHCTTGGVGSTTSFDII